MKKEKVYMKEIKDKLIEKYFNYNSKTVFLIEI